MLKIMSDKLEKAILIVPFWPAQNWFSLLNSNLIALPVRLPRNTDLLIMPHSGEIHPLRKRLNLIVCVVLGRRNLTEEFQQSLPMLSCHHGDQPQTKNISLLGDNLYFGAVNLRLILFNHLKRM